MSHLEEKKSRRNINVKMTQHIRNEDSKQNIWHLYVQNSYENL